MGMAMLREEEETGTRKLHGEVLPSGTELFDKLRELTRNGYVPDAGEAEPGAPILLRHASAPDLLLRPDGSIDLPAGQAVKAQPAERRRMSKLRTSIVILLAGALWFLSLLLTALFVEA